MQPQRPGGGKRFLFRGSAVGFGGMIWDPADVEIHAQASVTLPIVGGIAESTTDRFFVGADEFEVSFDRATARVEGRYEVNATKTRTTTKVAVDGIRVVSRDPRRDIEHVVTVGSAIGEMESTHSMNPGEQTKVRVKSKPKTDIVGLEIDGTEVDVTFAPNLVNKNTWDKLKDAYENDANFRKDHRKLFWIPPGHRAGKLPAKRGVAICTMVKRISGLPGHAQLAVDPAGEPIPNCIVIPDFGKLFLGEMVVTENDRRLVMMRFELGSPTQGSFIFSGPGSDGSTWPP